MLIDAHLHVWKGHQEFPDPTITTVSPASDIPVELLDQYMCEHGVDRAVLVQPLYPGTDNSYVAACAAAEPHRFRAVCVVDAEGDQGPSQLEYWVKEHGCRGVRLRPLVGSEEAAFGQPTSFPIWEICSQQGVVVSLLAGAHHISVVKQMAQQFPDVAIVIDHLAHPDVAGGVDSEEFRSLLNLAQYSRVFAKVSGFPYYSNAAYPYEDCREHLLALYQAFGAERLVWGSDFPHILLQSGYLRALKVVERTMPFLSSAEYERVMGENAAALYW